MQANVQVQPSKENQNCPPSPETKKTKILNKIQRGFKFHNSTLKFIATIAFAKIKN